MEISILPRFIIKRITENQIQQINWNILISTLFIIVSILFIQESIINSLPHFCLFEKLFGIQCPFCGVTRSILCLSSLEIEQSLKFNPGGIVISAAFVLQIPLRILALKNENYFPRIDKISRNMTRIILITIIVYWLYNLLT